MPHPIRVRTKVGAGRGRPERREHEREDTIHLTSVHYNQYYVTIPICAPLPSIVTPRHGLVKSPSKCRHHENFRSPVTRIRAGNMCTSLDHSVAVQRLSFE